ncbi:MAG TPA: hypothetical protein VD788_17075, partial [Candidatus Polarisedimenticolaceae bacterium]|nr:hypothetical protein [Candidatus Polarisedimenticolaceae bacterium]
RLFADYLERALATGGREAVLPDAGTPLPALARRRPPVVVERCAASSLAAARGLGRRTAEFHLALASDRRDGAFAPIPMTTDYLRALADDCARRAEQVVESLNANLAALPASVASQAHELLSDSSALIGRFRGLDRLRTDAWRIRVHGDYHLGQVLHVAENDFVLLDFEGEPLRTIGERREKYSPLKDVAGMIRSFGYAAHSAFIEAVGRHPERIAVREPWVRAWETWVAAAFLGAYLESAGDSPIVPGEADALQALLEAFLLDKAIYELGYELNHRPDWLPIPFEAIRSIAVKP